MFNREYSPTYNLLNWVHSMMNYMVWLAQTYLGQEVQAYLDAKHKGSLPKDWEEVKRALQT